jgi:hypothetical protein
MRRKRKLAFERSDPAAFCTRIGPVPAADGTCARIVVFDTTVKLASRPLNLTEKTPVNPEPVIVTRVLKRPRVGLKPEITGCTITLKLVELVPVPSTVVTAIGPVVAPAGTVVVICVSEFTLKAAATPSNVTSVAPVKPVPVTVTAVPTAPLCGVKDVTEGTAACAGRIGKSQS